jgi:hypothetical protein
MTDNVIDLHKAARDRDGRHIDTLHARLVAAEEREVHLRTALTCLRISAEQPDVDLRDALEQILGALEDNHGLTL